MILLVQGGLLTVPKVLQGKFGEFLQADDFSLYGYHTKCWRGFVAKGWIRNPGVTAWASQGQSQLPGRIEPGV